MEEAIDQAKGKKRAMESKSGSKKSRTFNLNTYKIHALGSYAEAIWLYGSPDNYNSQTVCNSFYSESKTHLTILTHTYCRVNLSTDEGSASSKGYAKENMPFMVLVFKYDGNV